MLINDFLTVSVNVKLNTQLPESDSISHTDPVIHRN